MEARRHPFSNMAATVRCPICQKQIAFDDRNMPFCSERCRIIDLGNWASEKYTISTPIEFDELQERHISEERKGSPS